MTSQLQTEPQKPSQPLDPVKQGKQEIEARYQASLMNHVYIFPRHRTSKTTVTPDTSLERLAETDIYDLYAQNPHTSTTNTNASSGKETSSEGTGLESRMSQKKEENGVKTEKDKVKVVSLGPIELINLYKKTLKSHRGQEANEEVLAKKSNKADPNSHKKYGSLIMKVVKSRHSKEKSLEDLYGITQKLTKGDIKDKKSRQQHQKNVSKDSSGFPEELLNALKGEFDGQNIETICVTEPLNPTTMVRKSEDKKPTQVKPELKERLVSKENSDKRKNKSKTINLYTTYKVAGPNKKAPGTKVVSQQELLEAFRKANKQEDKTQEKVVKPVKTVEIVKATGEVREVKEVVKEVKEVKETVKPKPVEKTREATREKISEKVSEKPQEKAKEIKMTLKKKVSMESTLPTERLTTSRNSNKTQVVGTKRGNTVEVNIQKKVPERQKTEENMEKKSMIEDALAVAKILDMARTMPVIKLDGNVKTKSHRNNTDIEEFFEKENDLARSSTFDSPIMKRRMQPRKIGMNLTVVTQSVVTQYEARERRREETRKKMMEVRKF